MKIELSQMQVHAIAEDFAKTIHAEIINMHLRITNDLFPHPAMLIERRSRSFREVQAAIASVTDKWERIWLIQAVHFHLNQRCHERGTFRKWQDHRAAVEKNWQRQRAMEAQCWKGVQAA